MGSVVSSVRPAEAEHAVPASTVDISAFRRAMGSFPTGVTVVTVASGDGNMLGMTFIRILQVVFPSPEVNGMTRHLSLDPRAP